MHVTISVHLGLLVHVYFTEIHRLYSRTVDYFLSLEAFLFIPGKLVFRKEAFRSLPDRGSLGSVSEVHGILRNRYTPFNYWGQPRAIAIFVML